jgi:hypothetical protein
VIIKFILMTHSPAPWTLWNIKISNKANVAFWVDVRLNKINLSRQALAIVFKHQSIKKNSDPPPGIALLEEDLTIFGPRKVAKAPSSHGVCVTSKPGVPVAASKAQDTTLLHELRRATFFLPPGTLAGSSLYWGVYCCAISTNQ